MNTYRGPRQKEDRPRRRIVGTAERNVQRDNEVRAAAQKLKDAKTALPKEDRRLGPLKIIRIDNDRVILQVPQSSRTYNLHVLAVEALPLQPTRRRI